MRTVLVNDEPYFVGKDIADVLGYSNSRKALADHVDTEDKDGVTIRDAIGREQIITVNEWTRQGLPQIIFAESSWPKYDVKDLDAWMAKFKV